MALAHSPRIIYQNLQFVADFSNSKSNISNSWTNLITGTTAASSPSWADGMTGYTCICVLDVNGNDNSYAYHPVSKWNAGTTNASFVLYHFQQQGGTNFLNWYANAGGSWAAISSGFYGVPGNKYVIGLQYNSTNGGQMWNNGSKNGSRGTAGVLGTGTGNIVLDSPNGDVPGIHRLRYCAMYNRELSDQEMLYMYNILKNRV
jgi:hypothetical protein